MWYSVLVGLWPARAPEILLGALFCALWIAIEYAARRRTWQQGASRRRSSTLDRGTYPIIGIALTISAAIDAVFFLGSLGPTLPLAASFVGAALMLSGLGLRYWAMDTLGRFFTNPITIHPDHVIVQDGPYRWIRHPAYTGGLFVAIGLPLVLGSLTAFAVALVLCGFAYVYRIHIEERALLERFGAHYEEYRATTSRLLPHVY